MSQRRVMFRTRRMWATVSKATGYVRIEALRKHLTLGSEWLDGPFRVEVREIRRKRRKP